MHKSELPTRATVLARLMLLPGMILISLALFSAGSAFAQAGPNGAINPNRDCQTIRTCQFKRGGEFRGCISTYSCRRCRFVRSNCSISGERKTCRRMTCSWGS